MYLEIHFYPLSELNEYTLRYYHLIEIGVRTGVDFLLNVSLSLKELQT